MTSDFTGDDFTGDNGAGQQGAGQDGTAAAPDALAADALAVPPPLAQDPGHGVALHSNPSSSVVAERKDQRS